MSDVITEDAPVAEEAPATEEVSVFDIPDSEFLAQGDKFDGNPSEEEHGTEGSDVSEDTSDTDADGGSEDDTSEDGSTDPVVEEAQDTGTIDGEGDQGELPSAETPSDDPAQKVEGPNYEEIGKQVMAEFKANGKPMSMKSAEDIIQLMQMGANYHSKMKGLKPSLKVLKLLEKNELLDETKINYLIDLSQKNPEAIKQLLQDSKLDPMEIDMDSESTYAPEKRTVSDTELILDDVLASMSDSPKYAETLNLLGTVWDDASRQIISQNPEIIRTINAHMESGIYYQVAQAVAYEQRLGKLTGLSDFQAYQQMGQYMDDNKLFRATSPAATVSEGNPVNNPAPNAENVQKQELQNPQDPPVDEKANADRLRRKAAASLTRKENSRKKVKKEYNPLEMSDEEFMKINKMQL